MTKRCSFKGKIIMLYLYHFSIHDNTKKSPYIHLIIGNYILIIRAHFKKVLDFFTEKVYKYVHVLRL